MAVRLETASQRAEARVGSVIKDKWTLDRLIGVGGMAAVYAATHRNKKRAAVKMLHAELSLDPVMRERFMREGYAANTVGQRGAVSVDDDDVAEDGCAFIVMELLDGESIDARWQRKGRQLPPQEVLSMADQVLETLAAAHLKGVVHRDIKPENLFLTRDGVVKVLDFGIARLLELKGPKTSTQAGNTMGTPAFMAPEQARGRWEDVDERTDLWAVAATMYTLLTGGHVHEGGTVNETLAMAVTNHAPSIRERRPDLHPELVELIDKALAYDKNERFSDAADMQQALRRTYQAVQGEDVSRAPQLSVPDYQSDPPLLSFGASQSGKMDRSRQMTTVGGMTASGQPTLMRSLFVRQRLAIVGVALGAVLAIAVLVATSDRAPARPVVGSASTAVAGASPAAPPPAPKTVVPSASVTAAEPPRAVSLEELPQEAKAAAQSKSLRAAPKATGVKRTPPDQDPFARRR